jgi:putative acetyltransferase
VEALREPSVTLFGLREDGELLGVAALREIDPGHGEVKSMHTAQAARGRGVARALLAHLVTVARERGYHRLSLETGAGPSFAPARRLYASAAFRPCEPFAAYRASPSSAYMTLRLP